MKTLYIIQTLIYLSIQAYQANYYMSKCYIMSNMGSNTLVVPRIFPTELRHCGFPSNPLET